MASRRTALDSTDIERKPPHRSTSASADLPQLYAYIVYDLSSPVFAPSELAAIFSPASSAAPPTSPTFSASSIASSTSSLGSDGWGPFLSSRIEHITTRPPTLAPAAVCVGEYTSASVAHPCAAHGVGQIAAGWDTHGAVKRFKQMIASTPVIKPSGHGPAQILKAYLDEFTGTEDPLTLTWVMKFLLLPKTGRATAVRLTTDPAGVAETEMRPVALICVRPQGLRMEELGKKLVQFGRLFSVEVMIVSSIAS